MSSEIDMDLLEFSSIVSFDESNVALVKDGPGVYIIYRPHRPNMIEADYAELYVGRSEKSVKTRLQCHLRRRGNKLVGELVGLYPGQLAFSYMYVPKYTGDEPRFNAREAEAILIAQIGMAELANLRHEGLYEEDLGTQI